jgi:prepilin-type N-terminal cleavage/methylation domain-containing protein
MDNRGFTLIEMMITILVLSGVMLGLYYVNLAMTRAALQHESMAVVRDDGRIALQQMSRILRMARQTSIAFIDGEGNVVPLGNSPVDHIQFQAADDIDGNGVAVAQDFSVEWTPIIAFGVDADDANGDGYSTTQLCQFDENAGVVQVFTNHLDPNGGLLFQNTNGGVQISLQLFRPASGNRAQVVTRMDQVVSVRN